jgi:hypothetical protein
VQNPKRNLSDVGLETKVKMAPNGRNATFYRLDVPQFVGMFVEWIEEKFGALTTQVRKLLNPKNDSKPQTQPESTFTFSNDDSQSVWFQPKEPEVVPTERVQTPWKNAYRPEPNQTVTDVWKFTQGQLEIQFDRASFETYLKHITLVDYDPDSLTFTLAAKHAHNVEMLEHRLHRNIRRVLSDIFGQDVQIVYISYDDWRDRHR